MKKIIHSRESAAALPVITNSINTALPQPAISAGNVLAAGPVPSITGLISSSISF